MLFDAILMTALAGAAIPLGAWLAGAQSLLPGPLRDEANHWILAFGAGALLSAVALVLVPQGLVLVAGPVALAPFLAGALAALLVDRLLARRSGANAQLLAMLLDFVPEAIALGALIATEPRLAILLATIIGAQNLPEGFNAEREMAANPHAPRRAHRLAYFTALVLAGPASALLGITLLADAAFALGALMLFAAGGILYLMFQDIAPQVPLRRTWSPPLGAVFGFGFGLLGHLLTG